MMTLNVTKKQDLTLHLKNAFWEKKHKEFDPPFILPAFLGLRFSLIN